MTSIIKFINRVNGITIGWSNHQYAINPEDFRNFINQIDEIEHGQWFEDDEAICCDINDHRLVIRFSNQTFRRLKTADEVMSAFIKTV